MRFIGNSRRYYNGGTLDLVVINVILWSFGAFVSKIAVTVKHLAVE